MKKLNAFLAAACGFFVAGTLVSCDGDLNSNHDSHFTDDGYFIPDSTNQLVDEPGLARVKFYVEVSGSMNGFFRANKPTRFKKDVWEVCSYYSAISPDVTILTNDGSQGANLPLDQFQRSMNTGAFVSSASTRVPVMIQNILNDLNTDKGEAAVLISDMKYDPVGVAGASVLPTQYSSDISRILGNFGKSVCLVGAVSDFLDKNGNVVTSRSPYYYFIMGNDKTVSTLRDGISTLLSENNDFVENIESGFSYGNPKYSFGIPNRCVQFEAEPTFEQYEENDGVDTCTIKLKVDLTPYRWLMTDKEYFSEAFSVKTRYGSEVRVGNIDIQVKNISNKKLERTAIASVDLKVFNMATDSEVLEWSLTLPDTVYTLFGEFCGSNNPNDSNKTYSLEDFIKGIFYGGLVNKSLKPNYILVSKNNS